MVRGLLGVFVAVGFFGSDIWVLGLGISRLVVRYMVFWVCCSKNNTTWVVGWLLVLRLCWCWMVV